MAAAPGDAPGGVAVPLGHNLFGDGRPVRFVRGQYVGVGAGRQAVAPGMHVCERDRDAAGGCSVRAAARVLDGLGEEPGPAPGRHRPHVDDP